MRNLFFAVCLMLAFCGCGRQEILEPVPSQTVEPTATEPVTVPPVVAAEAAAMVAVPPPPSGVVLQPEPSGEREERCDDAVIDYSHVEDGYVMARYISQTEQRLKLRVIGPTTTYTYNLPVDQWTVFPLSDGDGNYQVAVFINTYDSKYAVVMMAQFEVKLKDEFAPFLRPNQYVDYTEAVNTVEKGAALPCCRIRKHWISR